MGTREEYTTCMKPHMTGGGPDRKERFCIGAKLCSGKATTEEEAARLCAEAAANPKPKSVKRGKLNISEVAACVLDNLDGEAPTLATLQKYLAQCTGQKSAPATREKFIKKCFKDNTEGGGSQYSPPEAAKLRAYCLRQWREQEGAS